MTPAKSTAFFRCTRCGCVESVACCNYWIDVSYHDRPPRCSACDPSIGAWHGRFERRSADGLPVDDEGFVQWLPTRAGSTARGTAGLGEGRTS